MQNWCDATDKHRPLPSVNVIFVADWLTAVKKWILTDTDVQPISLCIPSLWGVMGTCQVFYLVLEPAQWVSFLAETSTGTALWCCDTVSQGACRHFLHSYQYSYISSFVTFPKGEQEAAAHWHAQCCSPTKDFQFVKFCHLSSTTERIHTHGMQTIEVNNFFQRSG